MAGAMDGKPSGGTGAVPRGRARDDEHLGGRNIGKKGGEETRCLGKVCTEAGWRNV